MTEQDRRNFLAMLAGGIGLAAVASAAPTLGQPRLRTKQPRPIVPPLNKAPVPQADAQTASQLDRTLRRANGTARATLNMTGSIEMADTMSLWENTVLFFPAGTTTAENLADGMVEALGRLLNASGPFTQSDGVAAGLGTSQLTGLAVELRQISIILDTCVSKLTTQQLEGVASDVAANTAGLANMAANCSTLAQRLAGLGSARPVKRPEG